MKAEINNENKAKFFAQYWGQEIGLGLNNQLDINSKKFKAQSAFTECIELKPLSQISDEDAELICAHHRVLSSDCKWSVNTGITLDSYSTDYLRSKGYTIPWMGLPVEEMVEAGWIKLT